MNVEEMYGKLMLSAIDNYINNNVISENLAKTVKWIRNELYSINANPRLSTLSLYLHYNLPSLEKHDIFIWDNLNTFKHYEKH